MDFKSVRKKEELFPASAVTLVMTFMNISGWPATLFLDVHILDIHPLYFTQMGNFVLTAVVFFLGWKIFYPNWHFGLGINGLINGLRKYIFSGCLFFLISTLAFYIGLRPFDNHPTPLKVLIEGFIYYIGVAFIEELYIRGLLLNILEQIFAKTRKASFYAILFSSLIFGIGHIFGVLGSSLLTIAAKVTWTVGLGLYLGAVYKNTQNLWVPIILHAIIDFCAWPFCFSTIPPYPEVSLWILMVSYGLLGIYGIHLAAKQGD